MEALESEALLESDVQRDAKAWLRQEQIMRAFLFKVTVLTISLLSTGVHATETFVPARSAVLYHYHRYVARIGPQSCFLMPDVVVALNALGPYCSSPRGPYRAAIPYYRHYLPSAYYVPYYGYYRPWGWSDFGRSWGW